jgi:hypothetical protein
MLEPTWTPVVGFSGELRPNFSDGFGGGAGYYFNFKCPGLAELGVTGLAGSWGLFGVFPILAVFQVSCRNRHDTL